MKKIVYSAMLCLVLVVSCPVVMGFDDEVSTLTDSSENLFEGKNSLDPIDSERSSGLHDPEVVDDQDWLKDDNLSDDTDTAMDDEKAKPEEKVHQTESMVQSAPISYSTDVAELPKLTIKELQEAVEKHEKIAEKYKELASNMHKIWAVLQGSELGKEINIVELTQLLQNAQIAHKNVENLFEVMLTIQKLGFELGSKLESELHMKAKDLSVKAQEVTEKATEELEKSLGLKSY